MNRRLSVCLLVLAIMTMAAPAWAQEPASGVVVKFPFVAAGKVLDPGTYAIAASPDGKVRLTPEKGGAAQDLTPVKTLNRRKVERPELVFELVGSMWFLTEAWIPGADGFQVGKVDASQERKSVKAPKAK